MELGGRPAIDAAGAGAPVADAARVARRPRQERDAGVGAVVGLLVAPVEPRRIVVAMRVAMPGAVGGRRPTARRPRTPRRTPRPARDRTGRRPGAAARRSRPRARSPPGTAGPRPSPRRRPRSTRSARRPGSRHRQARGDSRGRRTTRGGGGRSSPRRAARRPAPARPGRSSDARSRPATRTPRGRRAWRGSPRGSRACRGRGGGSPCGSAPARPRAGRWRGRSATEASAIIVDGLPAHAGRPASVAISASWAAAIAALPTSIARTRASAVIGARRIVPSSPVSRNT